MVKALKWNRWDTTAVLIAAVLGLFGGTLIAVKQAQAQEPDPATLLYVKGMGVPSADVGGPRRLPYAVVDIVDGYGRPVNDALVVGNWSGCFKQNNDSALTQTYFYTDYDGTVIQVDGRAKIWADKSYSCWGQKQKCYFTFTLTGIFKEGMTYVPVVGWGTSWSRTQCD